MIHDLKEVHNRLVLAERLWINFSRERDDTHPLHLRTKIVLRKISQKFRYVDDLLKKENPKTENELLSEASDWLA